MLEKYRGFYRKYLVVKIVTVILIVFLSIAIMIPLIEIAKLFGVHIRENTGLNFKVTFGNAFFFFLFGICSIGIIWAAQKYLHKKKISELGFQPKMGSILLIGFLFGAFLAALRYLLLILNSESVNYISVVDSNISMTHYVGYYLYFFIGFVLWNSFIEELTTRAYPIEKLKNYLNPHLIFTIMGLLFALGHLVLNEFSLGYFLSLFITSYIYSLLYFYSGSIWLSVGMHSGTNWIVLSFFGTNWKLGALFNIEMIGNIPYWITEYSHLIIQLIFLALVLYLEKSGVFLKYFPHSNRGQLLIDRKSNKI